MLSFHFGNHLDILRHLHLFLFFSSCSQKVSQEKESTGLSCRTPMLPYMWKSLCIHWLLSVVPHAKHTCPASDIHTCLILRGYPPPWSPYIWKNVRSTPLLLNHLGWGMNYHRFYPYLSNGVYIYIIIYIHISLHIILYIYSYYIYIYIHIIYIYAYTY